MLPLTRVLHNRVAGPLIGLLLLSGCISPPGSAPGSSQALKASTGPKVVTVAQPADATTMDANMHNDTPTRNIHLNLFDSLVYRLPDGSFRPMLIGWTPRPESYILLKDATLKD
jgi:hypothetical protein